MTDFWTAERIDAAKALWEAGNSATVIAAKIGAASRNAVIGKLGRLGVRRGAAPHAPRTIVRPSGRPHLAAKLKVPTAKKRCRSRLAPVAAPLTISGSAVEAVLSLGRGCKWPFGDPRGAFQFCGQPRPAGQPYCEAHAQASVSRP